MQEENQQVSKTPIKCRNGPIYVRSCTDWCCCVIYIILVLVVLVLVLMGLGSIRMSDYDVKQVLSTSPFGSPILAIDQSYPVIILSLAFVAALSFVSIVLVTTVPFVGVYIFLPLLIISTGLGGLFFLLRYFGVVMPHFLFKHLQQIYAQSRKIMVLAAGVTLLVGFVLSLIIIISSKAKFKNMLLVIKIGKVAFWPNSWIFLTSIRFILVSILFIFLSMLLLGVSQTKMHNIIHPNISLIFICIWMFWTHGIIQSSNDFFTESIAVNWYFKIRRQQNNQRSYCDTFKLTIQLEIKHCGTIMYAFIVAYVPQFVSTLLEQSNSRLSKKLFQLYQCSCGSLSKYSYIQTILQGHPFCRANKEMMELKLRAREMLPELYMMGNYYITLTKISMISLGMAAAFLLMEQFENEVLANLISIIGPMVIIFFGSFQVSNCIMNWSGVIGDTLIFMYVADVEMEYQHYESLVPHSCPKKVYEIIKKSKI